MPIFNEDIFAGSANLTVYVVGYRPSLSDRLETKLRAFANLQKGWDYGAGESIPQETIATALSWCNFLRSLRLFDIDAFPGGSGEILLGIQHDEHYIEVIIEPDNTISLAHDFRGKQEAYRPRMRSEDARKILIELAGRICGSFAYFIPIDSTRAVAGSQAWHSVTHQVTAALLLSTPNALMQAGQTSAPTLDNFIPGLPATQRYSGNLIPIYSPRHVA